MAIEDRDGIPRVSSRDEASSIGAVWLAGLAAIVVIVLGFAWGFAPGTVSDSVPGVTQEAPIVRDPVPPANRPQTIPSPAPSPTTPPAPQ